MKGYKGMDENMRCRGMQYELGKAYHVDGEIKLCENGLHFCENLNDVFGYYSRDDSNRFFEIEAAGDIKTDGEKSVSSDMTILRELSEIEVSRYYYNDRCHGNVYSYGNGYSYGYGYGYGYGFGNGGGYGNGNGYGNGYGYGDGYGFGYGNGYGDGYGNGNGDGYGYGDGDGSGDGNSGDAYRIIKFI